MKTLLFITFITLTLLMFNLGGQKQCQAQNIGINATGAAAKPSAGLDIDFTDKGLLIPRITTAQRDNIATNCSCTPTEGLQIFNTTTKCFEAYVNGGWYSIACPSACNAPSAPTANAASGVGCASFTANWSASTGATSYYLDVSTISDFSTFVTGYNNLNVGNVTSYSVTGLAASTTYYYRLRAATVCVSVNSNSITAVTTACTITFSYTGAEQTWVVPAGITTISVDVQGARGATYGTFAYGGRVQGTLAVTPGETLRFYVGNSGTAPTGGFNGGGNGAAGGYAEGGGGASDIRQGGSGLANRVAVAGGGGGYGGNGASGGHGGGTTGADGTSGSGGKGFGGTPSAGGAGGTSDSNAGTDGSSGTGGTGGAGPTFDGGGGGGGGYYGGGGGGAGNGTSNNGGGGGGGSSYSGGLTSPTHTQGYRAGVGQIIITW